MYYESREEFSEALHAIEQHRWLSGSLGRNGRQFFREHYDWPVLEGKYLDMLARLSKEPPGRSIEALPGWFERRRPACPPAEEVLARLPKGPAVGRDRELERKRA